MLTPTLQTTLFRALAFAKERNHEQATLEHLLLALIDDDDAIATLEACAVDIEKLRSVMVSNLDDATMRPIAPGIADPKPSWDFQTALQRAAIQVQSSGQANMSGADVLLAILSERTAPVVAILAESGVTRLDALNYIAHGLGKLPPRTVDVVSDDAVLTPDLEAALARAFADANRRRHEYMTLVHLLFALLDHPEIAALLVSVAVDREALRDALAQSLEDTVAVPPSIHDIDAMPTMSVKRVLQRAAIHVRTSGRGQVTPANLLLGVFGERESEAVELPKLHGLSRAKAAAHVARRVGGSGGNA